MMNNLLIQLFKFGLVGVVATVLDFLFLFLRQTWHFVL